MAVLAASPKPKKKKKQKPFAKLVIGGVVTVVFEAFAGGHLLEFLKIAKQTSDESYMTLLRKITAEKGLIGTLDGFVPWGLLQCAVKGAVFSWGQAWSYNMLDSTDMLGEQTQTILSGGMGGFIQGVAMSPLLLLKTRVMTDPSFRKGSSAWNTTVASTAIGIRVVREEGVLALTKGMGVFSFKRFLDWTTRFGFVELVVNIVKGSDKQKKLSMPMTIACSLAGGCLSAFATIPVDVTVAMIQDANKAGKQVNVVEIFASKMREGGIGETYRLATRGLGARVAHVATTTAILKVLVGWIQDKIYKK